MSIIRGYYSPHFDIDGSVLRIKESIANSANNISRLYTFKEGHTYIDPETFLPIDTSADFPVTHEVPGDAVRNTPPFSVLQPAEVLFIDHLQNGLRMYHSGNDTGGTWPIANTSPGIMIRLPPCQRVRLECRMQARGLNSSQRVRFGIVSRFAGYGTQPLNIANVAWVPTSPSVVSESVQLFATSFLDTTALETYTTYVGGFDYCERTYKFDIGSPHVAIYGSAAHGVSDPAALIMSRSSALTGGMGDLVFFFQLGTSGVSDSTNNDYSLIMRALKIDLDRSVL